MDNPTQIVPSALEYQYGPIADSYAQKYGIPTDMFRQAIQGRSGFDPNYSGPNGQGIAGLSFTQPGSINPMDPGASMDKAAQIMSAMYKGGGGGDWQTTVDTFLGNDAGTQTQAQSPNAPDNSMLGKLKPSSWLASFTEWAKNGAFTIVIVLIGLVLILGSVWMIIDAKSE